MIDLSPENVTKLDLSKFCEQMDQMYFLPASSRKPIYLGKQNNNRITPAKQYNSDESSIGLVSVVESIDLEKCKNRELLLSDEIQPELQFVPMHSIRWTQLSQTPQLHGTNQIFDTIVDWCGQPTTGAQWLKRHTLPQQRSLTSATASTPAAPARSVPAVDQPPVSRVPSARSETLSSSSIFGRSQASISADYRDLEDSDVAKDVAVLRLGGSSVDPERRFWNAFMRRRPYPIRKSLSAASQRPGRIRQLEFVSLSKPVPEVKPRAATLSSDTLAIATSSEPPPGTPTSRPATAASLRLGGIGHQRPITGRPRHLLPAAAAAAASASVSFSDFGEVAPTPPPPVFSAMPPNKGSARSSSAAAVPRRRSRMPSVQTETASPVQLELLGNRFKYPVDTAKNGLSTMKRPVSCITRIGASRAPAVKKPDFAVADPVLAELAKLIDGAHYRSPTWNHIAYTTGDVSGSSPETAPTSLMEADGDHLQPVRETGDLSEPHRAAGLSGNVQAAVNFTDDDIITLRAPAAVDPERAGRAALVIQRRYRGYDTRQRLSRLEQQARAQGFESLGALRRYCNSLIWAAGQRRSLDLVEMQRFLEDKRRIELAFDTTVRYHRRHSRSPSSQCPASQDLMKVFNVCGHFPSRQSVEQAVEEWRLRSGCQGNNSHRLDRSMAVEIFYLVQMRQPTAGSGSPRRSPRPGGAPPQPPPPELPKSPAKSLVEQPLTVRVKIQWTRD